MSRLRLKAWPQAHTLRAVDRRASISATIFVGTEQDCDGMWDKHMKPPDGSQQQPPKYNGKTIYVPPAGSDPKEIIKALDDFEANALQLSPDTPIAMDQVAVGPLFSSADL